MYRFTLLLICMVCSIVCAQTTITVDDDGPADFSSIQEAINASSNGDTIVVMQGNYSENLNFKGRAILVTSSDSDDPNVVAATVISPVSNYSVTFGSNERISSMLEGLTITGKGIYCYASSPLITKCVVRDCTGIGITGDNNAKPTILKCTIINNGGRGIFRCNGEIQGSVISYNSGGGLAECGGAINGNVISYNDYYSNGYDGGGGLRYCNGEISDNIITNNWTDSAGGGLCQCHGLISGNTIVGNMAKWDGAGLYNCLGEVNNNIVAGNRSFRGAGLAYCQGTIENNTIVGNRAEEGAALYACTNIKNNIIAYNEAFKQTGGIHGSSAINTYNLFWENDGNDIGGGAVFGLGTILSDPLFTVNGYWDPNGTVDDTSDDFWVDGDYHVKSEVGRWSSDIEKWVQDDVTSPCIDKGDPNSNWYFEFWPHGERINIGRYGGTSQASMSLSSVGDVADLNLDDLVDFDDLRILTRNGIWLSDYPLLREDLDRNGIVNMADFAILTSHWHTSPPVPIPPTPNPMTWESKPAAVSDSSIVMTATKAVSTDGSPVEYYFEDYHHPVYNSGWISEASWQDSGLSAEGEFCYRVKARNSANLLETEWSTIECATTLAAIPPNPDPMTWAVAPAAISPDSITMTATTATPGDSSSVEYFFTNTTISGHDSGWRTSSNWTDTGLAGLTQYSYKVKARNIANQVETGWSVVQSATTADPDVTPPSPNPMQWAQDGEPTKVQKSPYGFNDWYADMTAVEATDSSGVEYKFICSESSFSSEWQDSPSYSVHIGQQAYYVTFYVIARDKSGNHNQTQPSSTLPWQK